MMLQQEKCKLLESAAEELASFIRMKNEELKTNISCTDLDPPDYYDYQTCYELMVFAKDL